MITTSTNRTNTNRQPKTFWQSFEYRFCWGGERTICWVGGGGGGQRTEQHTLARTTHCVTMCTFLWARTHLRTHPLAHSRSLVLFSTTALSLSPSLTQNQPKDRPTHSKSLKSTKKIQILFSAVIQPEKKKQHSYTHTHAYAHRHCCGYTYITKQMQSHCRRITCRSRRPALYVRHDSPKRMFTAAADKASSLRSPSSFKLKNKNPSIMLFLLWLYWRFVGVGCFSGGFGAEMEEWIWRRS